MTKWKGKASFSIVKSKTPILYIKLRWINKINLRSFSILYIDWVNVETIENTFIRFLYSAFELVS